MDRVRGLWGGFLAAWGFTLVAWGGVRVPAVACATAALAALNLAAPTLKMTRAGVAFLGACAALFALQLLPLAPLLFPVTQAWRQTHGVGSLWPATADTFRTLLALAQFALYALSALLILRLRQAGLGASTILKGAVALLALEAAYGLVQAFAGLKDIPFYGPRPSPDSASGTLVGRNNFAGLMAVGFVLSVALAWGRFSWPHRAADDPGKPRWIRRLEGGAIWALAAGLFAVAIVLSRSRGGALAALGGALLLPFASRGRGSVAGAAAVLLVAVGSAAVAGLQPLLDRFGALDPYDLTSDSRWKIFATTVAAALRQPVLGFGLGTHPVAYLPYQPPSIADWVHHAHNEYVNLFFEAGAAGLLLLIAALAFWFVRAWRAQQALPGPDRLHVTAAICGVAATALHSFVDFDLRIPSNGILFAALIGLGAAATRTGAECPRFSLAPPIVSLAAVAALFLGLNPEPMVERARASETAEMERLARRALGLSPYEYRAAWVYARVAQRKNDPPLADRRFETAADLWPAHPGVQKEAGLWFLEADDPRAAKCFHRLFEQEPWRVAEVMEKAGGPDDRLIPPVPAAAAAYAAYLVRRGEWARGVKAFEGGVPARAEHADLYDSFAAALGAAGQWGVEATMLDRRLAVKSDPSAYGAAARAWLKLGVHDEAQKRVELAARIDLANAAWPALKGDILRAKGERLAATEAYTEALAKAPMELAWRESRGFAYLELKMYAPAAADFREALRSRPKDRGLVLGLAQALAGLGQSAAARMLLDDWLRKSADDAAVRRVRDSLPP